MLVLFAACATARAEGPLVPLARIGPWHTVSGLVGYGGRLWLVNSVKFPDHNSADVYSYDPRSGELRYERHLFSQDAGRPAVAHGLLYFPFEDARFSQGQGELMATDGRGWRWLGFAAPGRVLHLHALHAHRGALYAASGGFEAALHRSEDRGASWRTLWRYANAPGSFSRLLSLATLGGELYAGMYASDEPGGKLLRLRGGVLEPVRGWPDGDSATALTAFRGRLYAIHEARGEARLWRADGRRAEPVAGFPARGPRALASGGGALWALAEGALWKSTDGESWRALQRFGADDPVEVAVYAGRAYVGAIGTDGRGVLYGPAAPAPREAPQRPAPLPEPFVPSAPEDVAGTLARLDRALGDFAAFEAGGGSLQELVAPLAVARDAVFAEALAERLGRVPRDGARLRFAGREVAAADKADWTLLWAMARSGRGHVPQELLARAFGGITHRGEKYVDVAPAAAWAVAEIGQRDAQTLEALVARLERSDDPPWLGGDFVGALAALSGCIYGYDAPAWRAWLASRGDCRGAEALIAIPGGTLVAGDVSGEADESPRRIEVKSFRLMRNEVTNREFAAFVAATGHMTDVERRGAGYVWSDRWREVRGANWRRPQGPGSSIAGLEEHPAVQVSARDAAAYCRWRGLRLPSEMEWEYAARGGDGRRYPWGDEPPAQRGARRANFGTERCCARDGSDGFARTAPVGRFPAGASPFGIHDMAGNVWEWTSDRYREGADEFALRGGGWGNDAYGLRASYRHGNPPDIGLDMVGIRCAGN